MKFVMASAFNNSQHLFRTIKPVQCLSFQLTIIIVIVDGCGADSFTRQCTRLLMIGMYPYVCVLRRSIHLLHVFFLSSTPFHHISQRTMCEQVCFGVCVHCAMLNAFDGLSDMRRHGLQVQSKSDLIKKKVDYYY